MSTENLGLFVGVIAGILTAISMVPQVIKTVKEKKAEHVSPFMLIILIAGVAIWIVYGFLKHDLPIILTNSFSFLINVTMLILRKKYTKTN